MVDECKCKQVNEPIRCPITIMSQRHTVLSHSFIQSATPPLYLPTNHVAIPLKISGFCFDADSDSKPLAKQHFSLGYR